MNLPCESIELFGETKEEMSLRGRGHPGGSMGSGFEPRVSVVTPAFNDGPYLAECIESVLAQTYQNWDYTIVDNCSTDESVEIARRYAERDSRIRFQQNNQFLRAICNHNAALRQISSESKYCKVVFADDWIFPNCLEQMVALAEAHPSVGVVGAYALDGDKVAWAGLPYPSTVVCGREICRRHLLDRLYVFGTANCVLYRSDLVRSRDPFYNEANIHADTEICFTLFAACDFGFVHQILSFTRQRQGSLSTITKDLQTDLACTLQLLTVHGPVYLTHDERDSRLAEHLSEYYGYLGKSLILGRNKQFWEYHRRELTKAGVGFSRTRVVRGTLETLCDAALNPKNTVQRFLRSRHSRPLTAHRNVPVKSASDAHEAIDELDLEREMVLRGKLRIR